MCLSTNLVYLEAYASLAAMARSLDAADAGFARRHRELSDAIERRLWSSEHQRYAYFTAPSVADPDPGLELDLSQETLGLALSVIFGAAPPARARSIVASTYRAQHGVVNVWPHLQHTTAVQPGRHNAMCWPMVMGVWAQAAAQTLDLSAFTTDLDHLVDLVAASDYRFFEVYDPTTGLPDGGWQAGRAWRSEPDQTWSASALIGAVLFGVFGIELLDDGMRFKPLVPAGVGPLALHDLPYRDAFLNVEISVTAKPWRASRSTASRSTPQHRSTWPRT